MRARLHLMAAVLAVAFAAAPALAQTRPSGIRLSGEARVRYEALDGRFRAGREGGDQLIALRTLLKAEVGSGPIGVVVELQDSRTYAGDAGTPLSTSFTNTLEALQAHVRLTTEQGPAGSTGAVQLGRMTLDIGSRRFVERNDFRNTINAYTGAYWRSDWEAGHELHAFYVVPVRKFPRDRASLDDNRISGDEEEWGRRFWGVHARRADFAPGVWGELFVYGLNEDDTADVATPNRDYVSPGARVFKPSAPGEWDVDIEAAYRVGERRATSDPGDETALSVRAGMVHAAVGYTFEGPWRLRVAAEYDFASGDDDPNDDAFDQYERLFGTRRGDLGNTSINGPLTRANLNAPGGRLEFRRGRFDGRLHHRAAFLASATDAWIVARVRDPEGRSGRFVGHAIDGRVRCWLRPGVLRAELGASSFLAGRFARTAPNAAGQGDTTYGYAMLTATF